jgi:hypothetical protein
LDIKGREGDLKDLARALIPGREGEKGKKIGEKVGDEDGQVVF